MQGFFFKMTIHERSSCKRFFFFFEEALCRIDVAVVQPRIPRSFFVQNSTVDVVYNDQR